MKIYGFYYYKGKDVNDQVKNAAKKAAEEIINHRKEIQIAVIALLLILNPAFIISEPTTSGLAPVVDSAIKAFKVPLSGL